MTPGTGLADRLACCSPFGGEVLTDEQAQATAALFRALGDPHRVQIVNLLASWDKAVCVCELTEPLGLGQPTVSHHLRRLREAGLLEREQQGRWAYYSLRGDVTGCLAAVMAPRDRDTAEPAPVGRGGR